MRLGIVGVLVLVACGPHEVMMDPPPRDVRVAIPAEDPLWMDFVTPESIVPPSGEKMWCTDIRFDGDATAFDRVEAMQGKFGHHIVMLTTTKPKEPGTTYDCTDRKTMMNFRPIAIPAGDLPAGMGTMLPKGTALTIQSHYVNTSTSPILIRDVLRLRKIDIAKVTTWAAPMTFLDLGFMLPPRSSDVSYSFDCTFQNDVKLLNIGPHMHEYGSRIELKMGPDVDHLVSEIKVDQWKPEYRDDPPVNIYTQNPRPIAKGTVLRTTCTWNNTTDHVMEFPEEMCVSFGMVAGTQEPALCVLNGELM